MPKIVMSDVRGGYNLSAIEENFDKIATELNDKVLYRNNPPLESNTVHNDVDMNGNRIYNLPAPNSPNEPARLQDLQNVTGGANLTTSVTSTSVTINSDSGTDATILAASATDAGVMTAAEQVKLAGIQAGATANDTDANLKNRANHTGTQLASTISDLPDTVRNVTAAQLVAGANVTITPAGDTLVVSAASDRDALLNDLASTAVGKGGELVAFKQGGAGAVDRTVQGKLREFVSVKDFGAVGDGVADDTAAIQAAVTHCYTTGNQLYWPAGVYMTTASVTNFHRVRHSGLGVIKRGSDFFYITPETTTNTIYVATTGSASNDGLSASQPMNLPQKAFDAMVNYGPALRGNWVVQLAAGTYTPGNAAIYQRALKSEFPIVVKGPDVGGHPNVPAAILDGTGSSYARGIFLENSMTVNFRDIKLVNWTGAGTSGGLYAANGCLINTENVHVNNCGYFGLSSWIQSSLYIDGGIIENVTNYGVYMYQSAGTVGINGAMGSNRPILRNNWCNIYYGAYANGHVAFVDGSNCTYNLWINGNSRIQLEGVNFSGASTTDILCDGYSVWFDNGAQYANTLSSGNKYIHAHGICENDKFWEIHDKTNGRRKWGGIANSTPSNKFHFEHSVSGASFLTDAGGGTVLIDAAADNIVQLNCGTSAGLYVNKAGKTGAGQLIYVLSDDSYRMAVNGNDSFRWRSDRFYAMTDNAYWLGAPTYRWSTIYAGTGTINTSDGREKQQVRNLSGAERAVAMRLKGLVRAFKFNNAVEEKGDGARTHFGVIAQDVKAAFEAEGLVAEDYAVLCYDEWSETPEERNEEGKVTQEYRPAGNRYGVRYEELLAFIIGAL